MKHQMRRSTLQVTAATVLIALLGAACSSGATDEPVPAAAADSTDADDATNGEGTDSADDGATSSSTAEIAAFQATVSDGIEAVTGPQEAAPPRDGPPGLADQTVAVVMATREDAGALRALAGVEEALTSLGWDWQVLDGRGDPSVANNAIQQVVAQQPDGLVLIALEAQLVENGIQAAKDAEIPISCAACWDLSDTEEFRGSYDAVTPSLTRFADMGYALGQFAYQETGGDVRAIMMNDPSLANITWRQDGFRRFIDECAAAGGACEVVAEEDFLLSELTTGLPTQAAAVARANPDFNVFEVSFDFALSMAVNGLEQAQIDLSDSFGLSSNGDPEAIERVTSGAYQRATVAIPLEWMGWGAVDNLNRILSGQSPVDQNEPIRLITPVDELEENVWEGDTDFRTIYEQSWSG